MTAVQDDIGLWIRRYHPAPDSAIRLLCLPHAGGSASFYFPVSRSLSPTVETLAVQYPGRQDRRSEPNIDDLPTLARGILGALDGWLDKPLALFGHSMGATVGFELARMLEQERGVVPAWLFTSGRRAPSMPRDERIHQESDEGFIAELRRLNGTDGNILGDEEMLRMILPAARSDYRAAETYRYVPGAPLSCPVTAFVGNDDPKVTVAEARAWEQHTTAEFDFHQFDGGHFYLTTHQTQLLKIMADQLRSVSFR
ncbi:thioesterase II family protein [Streptomyces boncukensis]|uniref:Thioesterase n=1 Tax=Streptomyces boncukensis TaxID=2711219 RepID=A0A6G4WUU4_9ACTN|nr:thioesterase II family protein [Streptomyces boncukensis]NGO68314.1 thioesterase [Streptomyces boncukensis]